jgi:speckle-type POZ protein
MAAELYIAASQYEMTTLKEECKKYLIRHMSPEDCAELLLHANRVLDKDDFMRAAKYFWRNIGAVINTDKWKKENLECPAFIRVVQELLIHNKFFFTSA